MQNATIHGIASNRYPTCTMPTEKLGEYLETPFPTRSDADYDAAYWKSYIVSLKVQGVKNLENTLWSVPNVNPPDLGRADILHNILLRVLVHVMDWIEGFLEHYDQINAFDYVWHWLPPYPGVVVPTKSYRMVSQWSGKELRHFVRVILDTFTVALRWTTNQPYPTGSQVQEFNTAIQCVRSMTDFYLMTQYDSHTDKTVSYMQKYLGEFHETKGIFLCYRAGKGAKRAAAEAHKVLLREQTETSVKGLTALEKAKLHQEDALECQNLVDEILREGAHYNFPKMHLISHYAEQIPKFGVLKQYSMDISECMHKGFKKAYRPSNKVNTTSQMITNYTRDHTFIMKDLTIDVWNRIRQGEDPTADVGMGLQTQMYLRLQSKIDLREVSNLEDLEPRTGLCGLKLATETFLRQEL